MEDVQNIGASIECSKFHCFEIQFFFYVEDGLNSILDTALTDGWVCVYVVG